MVGAMLAEFCYAEWWAEFIVGVFRACLLVWFYLSDFFMA